MKKMTPAILGFFIFASLASCSTQLELANREMKKINAGTWKQFATLVDNDLSRIFKNQDAGNILIAKDGHDSDDRDDVGAIDENWALSNMSSDGKTAEAAFFPKLQLLTSLENVSLVDELEELYVIIKKLYFKP